jgi:hypothetical protein
MLVYRDEEYFPLVEFKCLPKHVRLDHMRPTPFVNFLLVISGHHQIISHG